MHPTASNCTTISRPSLSEEVGDFAIFHCLLRSRGFVEMIVWTQRGVLVLACLKQQCARNLWTSAQGYLAINWRGEVGMAMI